MNVKIFQNNRFICRKKSMNFHIRPPVRPAGVLFFFLCKNPHFSVDFLTENSSRKLLRATPNSCIIYAEITTVKEMHLLWWHDRTISTISCGCWKKPISASCGLCGSTRSTCLGNRTTSWGEPFTGSPLFLSLSAFQPFPPATSNLPGQVRTAFPRNAF